MKRILIALVVLLSVQIADAQVKTREAAKKAVDKALEATQNEKKAAKADTWMKLATAYMDAYNAPMGSAWIGAQKQELQLLMGGEKPRSSQQVDLGGEPCTKEVYKDKEFYFNQNGQLVLINVTKPVVENPLDGAFDAYRKAWEVDRKKSQTKKLTAALDVLAKKYLDEGMNSYMLQDYAAASQKFEKAAEAAAAEPLSKVDSTAIYNAGFTAWMIKDYPRAKTFFEKCIAINYYYDDGEAFAKLSDVNKNLGDTEGARVALENGFSKFPQSQSILIGLINYYVESGSNTDRLFELIDQAKQNEPNNASLHYVEGNINNELRQKATDPAVAEQYLNKAVAAYDRCAEIDANYAFGHIGKGVMYYNIAIDLQEKASAELDDKKWMALTEQFEAALMNALDPFEKAYAASTDSALKVNIAEYLKNIYYRFSSKGTEYEQGYNKYNTIVKEGKAL